MFYIRMADLNIQIENRYKYVHWLCQNYMVAPMDHPDLTVSISEEEIRKELEHSRFPDFPEYAEGVCIYRRICKQLPKITDAFLLHCALIEYEGAGYAFAAKSGTGKSTHISFWQKKFGNDVHIVNGDKPILRFKDDALYGYGTPWCGKENLQINTSVPLKAICFLERGLQNEIRPIGADEAVMRIFHQILTPEDLQSADALIPLLDRTLREIPCYVLSCNMSEEAAEVAYQGMNSATNSRKECGS